MKCFLRQTEICWIYLHYYFWIQDGLKKEGAGFSLILYCCLSILPNLRLHLDLFSLQVMGLPRKRNYAGRWDVLIDKATKCLNRMLEIASKRKRNYIVDQVNGPLFFAVYLTACFHLQRNNWFILMDRYIYTILRCVEFMWAT